MDSVRHFFSGMVDRWEEKMKCFTQIGEDLLGSIDEVDTVNLRANDQIFRNKFPRFLDPKPS